jgi:hypothetical protein
MSLVFVVTVCTQWLQVIPDTSTTVFIFTVPHDTWSRFHAGICQLLPPA